MMEMEDRNKFLNLLEQRTSINEGTDCWEYLGTNAGGYGQITVEGKFYYTHQLSAMIFLGYDSSFSNILHVLHNCNNRKCWNPSHLRIGTNDENIRDKMNAGRSRNQNTDVTQCKHGHEFTEENTYWTTSTNGNPRRQCRECKRIVDLKSKAKRGLIREVG